MERMTEEDKKKNQRGMPWWRQSHAEILSDMNLRFCFPKGKFAEGLALYLVLKAITSAQYEEDTRESCTFSVTMNFLIGALENSLTEEEIKDYCNRMNMRNVIDHFVVDDFILTITIYRIYDEVDKYRQDQRSAKKNKPTTKQRKKKKKTGDHDFDSDEEYESWKAAQNYPKIV